MKIIILASGKGTRLGFFTNNTPKPLIDLGNGKTVLETQLENIRDSKVIDEVIIVAGHYGDQVEAKIKKYQEEGMKIKVLHNPFYEFSNNLMTLWLVKHEMTEDFMVTNGDNIFEKDVFYDLYTKNKDGIFLTAVSKEKYYNDDMKVIQGKHGIEKVSKSIENEKSHGESVGLSLASGERYVKIFRETLEELGKDKSYLNKFWLEIFNKIADRGGLINHFEIDIKKWTEIDIHMDLKELLDLVQKNREDSLNLPENLVKNLTNYQKQLSKPILIFCGMMGTGKTTFSKYLLPILPDYERFNTDDVRRILGKTKFDRKDTPIVNDYMYSKSSRLIQEGKGVLFDSAYKTKIARENIYQIGREFNIPVIVIEFICSPETAITRIENRESKDYLHKPTNKAQDYSDYVKLFENPEEDLDYPENDHVSLIRMNTDDNMLEVIKIKEKYKPLIERTIRFIEGHLKNFSLSFESQIHEY